MSSWGDTFENRVRAIITEPQNGSWPHTRTVLRAVSGLYATAMQVRAQLYRHGLLTRRRLPCKVISVGNLTLGGTGKTPMTLYLGRLMQRLGLRAAILSRGYGGQAEKRGGVVSNGSQLLMTAELAGDEPCMMASRLNGIPVLVGRDRCRSGLVAVRQFGAQVVILDDGFQHLRVARDLDIVLLDGRHPVGNGFVLPRGPLRESLQALERADAIVITRARSRVPAIDAWLSKRMRGRSIYYSDHCPVIEDLIPAGAPCRPAMQRAFPEWLPAGLGGRAVMAFAGLAQNASFWHSVRALGGDLVETMAFPDHYWYSTADLRAIGTAALRGGCDCLATSAKDFARMPIGTRFPVDLAVVGVEIDFGRQTQNWDAFIAQNLGACVNQGDHFGPLQTSNSLESERQRDVNSR